MDIWYNSILRTWLKIWFILMGIRYKILEYYIETGFCLLLGFFYFNSNVLVHCVCPHESVNMGHGGVSSTLRPLVILFGSCYETHCYATEFHLACVHHKQQGLCGGEEERQVLCLCPLVTGRGTPLKESQN